MVVGDVVPVRLYVVVNHSARRGGKCYVTLPALTVLQRCVGLRAVSDARVPGLGVHVIQIERAD